jgi:hypothetical protein
MPKAVSDTVSHCTLTARSIPLVRDTFKYIVLLASSMSMEVALKWETNGLWKAEKHHTISTYLKCISHWQHIFDLLLNFQNPRNIHKFYTPERLELSAQK